MATMENVATGGSDCGTAAQAKTNTTAKMTTCNKNLAFMNHPFRIPVSSGFFGPSSNEGLLCRPSPGPYDPCLSSGKAGFPITCDHGELSCLYSQEIRQHHNAQHAERHQSILQIAFAEKLRAGH